MNKVYLFAYRDWALKIATDLDGQMECVFVPEQHKEEAELSYESYDYYNEKDVLEQKYELINPKRLDDLVSRFDKTDLLLFYGWSWMVPKSFTDNFVCICLHPSPLPKYRGGSPIQNQVIAGETMSAVTLFKMTDGLDDGPVYAQKEISLSGYLENILRRISHAGYTLTKQLIFDWKNQSLSFKEQEHSLATFCKRRKPDDGEIKLTDSALEIYNKVRCLQPPYPSAFIKNSAGEKIYITSASLKE